MANLQGFNAEDVQPTDFDCLPAGQYEVVITASEMRPTQSGNGKYLWLEMQVLSGEHQNRKLWDRLNLENPNEKAVQIARGTLSSICRAVGVLTPNDSSELHNKPMLAKVTVNRSEQYGDRNEIKAYKPRHAGPAPASTPSEGGTPW